jgi:hypothetical protein
MDEVGYDGNDKHMRVFVTKNGKRKFQVVSGELGPLWVTQVLWSCANGTTNIVLTVIQQGSTLTSFKTKNLSDNWVVHTTQSGVLSLYSHRRRMSICNPRGCGCAFLHLRTACCPCLAVG